MAQQPPQDPIHGGTNVPNLPPTADPREVPATPATDVTSRKSSHVPQDQADGTADPGEPVERDDDEEDVDQPKPVRR